MLVEGYYLKNVEEQEVRDFFKTVLSDLELTAAGEPQVNCSYGLGSEENQGYEAHQPVIESGISLYVWTNCKFLSMIVYTCKKFDEDKVLRTTRDFFKLKDMVSASF